MERTENRVEQLKHLVVGKAQTPDYLRPEPIAEGATDAQKQKRLTENIALVVKRAQDFSSNEEFWKKLLSLIEQARIAAAEKRWIAAEQALTEAAVLVNRAVGSEALKGMRVHIALGALFWFLVLFVFERLVEYLQAKGGAYHLVAPEYFQYLWLGMLGGTTMVLWGIVKHTKNLTFDASFLFWYFLKPALGAIMGVVVVLVVKAGFFTLQGSAKIENETPLLVLAFLAGFSERFFIRLIDKVVTSVLGSEEPSGRAAIPASAMKPNIRAVGKEDG
ncbi:MAG: hypothetical protein ACRDGA_13060 [Bacteroidota bacterium]